MRHSGRLLCRHRSRQSRRRHQDGQDAERRVWSRLEFQGICRRNLMSTAAIPIDIPQSPRQVTAPSLSATGVTKRFGSLLALDDVSMTVRPGTMHALLGGNGAGKSTLVKCIMGYYLPDEGQIALGGKPVIIR